MKTRVVNIHHKEPYDVYIGRSGKGQDGYFGNPYRAIHDKDEDRQAVREKVVREFDEYFYRRLDSDPEFKRRVHELKGKVLGCFCKPKLCHGDIIVEYIENEVP